MRYRKVFTLLLTLMLVLSAAVGVNAASQSQGSANKIKLTEYSGTVAVTNASGNEVKVKKDLRLFSGYTISTGTKSSAYVLLDDTKAIMLESSTKVTLKKSGNKIEVMLDSGTIVSDISKKLDAKESLNIHTTNMVTGIRGTGVEVSHKANTGATSVSMLDGTTENYVKDPTQPADNTQGTLGTPTDQPAAGAQTGQGEQNAQTYTVSAGQSISVGGDAATITPQVDSIVYTDLQPETQKIVVVDQKLSETVQAGANDSMGVSEMTTEEKQTVNAEINNTVETFHEDQVQTQETAVSEVQELRETAIGNQEQIEDKVFEVQSTVDTSTVITQTIEELPEPEIYNAPASTQPEAAAAQAEQAAEQNKAAEAEPAQTTPAAPASSGSDDSGSSSDDSSGGSSGDPSGGTSPEKQDFTVTYNVTGDVPKDYQAPAQAVYASGVTVTVEPVPSRTGYDFSGWNKGDEPVSESFTMPSDNVQLNGEWAVHKHTATFILDQSSFDIQRDIPYGNGVTLPQVSVSEGWEFSGWKNADGSDIPSDFTMPDSDVTFYGELVRISASYTVKHLQQDLVDLSIYNEVTDDEETMYGEVGGTTAASANSYTGFSAQTIEQKTITADGKTLVEIRYDRDSYTVSFVNSSGTAIAQSQSVIYGAKASDPTVPDNNIPEGHYVAGWEKNGQTFDIANTSITDDTNLTAVWGVAVLDVNFYTDSEQNSPFATEHVSYGQTVTAPAVTNGDLVFDAWYDKATNKVFDFSTQIKALTNLYATWKKPVSFTAPYMDTISSDYACITMTDGKNTVISGNGSFSFDTFAGRDVALVVLNKHHADKDFESIVPASIQGVTITPVQDSEDTYAITDFTDDVELSFDVVVKMQLTSGYSSPEAFASHYYNSQGTTPGLSSLKCLYPESYTGTIDNTGFVTYESYELYFKVSFDNKDIVSPIQTQTVRYNTAADRPADPVHANGLTFDGWYNNPDRTDPFDFSKPVLQDETLYAKWTTGKTLNAPSNIDLGLDSDELNFVWTGSSDSGLIKDDMSVTYTINKGRQNQYIKTTSINKSVSAMSVKPLYSHFADGTNTVGLTITVEPTESAEAEGYVSGTAEYQATLNYTIETQELPQGLTAKYTNSADGGTRYLSVSGLNANKSYTAVLSGADQGSELTLDFKTDGSGNYSVEQNAAANYTTMQLSERSVSLNGQNSASITERKYNGNVTISSGASGITTTQELQSALAAAGGETVQLTQDLSGSMVNFSGSEEASVSATLDLNGHTLNLTSWLAVGQNATLTVKGNGSIISSGSYALTNSSGNLTVEGGTFKASVAPVYQGGGVMIINSGSFTAEGTGNDKQALKGDGGEITVKGGNFDGGDGGYAVTVTSNANMTLNINGGTFSGTGSKYEPATVYASAAANTVHITGGTFDLAPADGFIVQGYYSSYNEDTHTWTVKQGDPTYGNAVAEFRNSGNSQVNTLNIAADNSVAISKLSLTIDNADDLIKGIELDGLPANYKLMQGGMASCGIWDQETNTLSSITLTSENAGTDIEEGSYYVIVRTDNRSYITKTFVTFIKQ